VTEDPEVIGVPEFIEVAVVRVLVVHIRRFHVLLRVSKTVLAIWMLFQPRTTNSKPISNVDAWNARSVVARTLSLLSILLFVRRTSVIRTTHKSGTTRFDAGPFT
jgi:hypothetical protein